MAYVITNKQKSISFISKDLTQLQGQYPGYQTYENGIEGHLITISDADFTSVVANEKDIKVNEDLTVTLTDITYDENRVLGFASKQELDNHINFFKERLKEVIERRISPSSYKDELIAYKALLENFDTSSISYPLTMTFERYLINQNQPVLSYLQII
jgi:thiamine phosphate synthase YjbQ (UPF0047 family)